MDIPELCKWLERPLEGEVSHWMADRMALNLQRSLETTPEDVRTDIYAIAVGLEPCALYLEGSFNTHRAWSTKERALPAKTTFRSKWYWGVWSTLPETFYAFGSLDAADETEMRDKWVALDERAFNDYGTADRFWPMVIEAIHRFRTTAMQSLIGRDIPVICVNSNADEIALHATKLSNPCGQAKEYLEDAEHGRVPLTVPYRPNTEPNASR